jgi:hypothetical protein
VRNATQSEAFRIQREFELPEAAPLALVNKQKTAAIVGGKSVTSQIN